jgi:RNA polymerase sigma factor (TIGR02999 family)
MGDTSRFPGAVTPPLAELTRLLNDAGDGDERAAAAILPLVYDQLRRLAGQNMRNERPDQTLQATALVHEAYLRLVGGGHAEAPARNWHGRGHFFAAAAEAMRRILVDAARRKQRPKHGGDLARADVEIGCAVAAPRRPDRLLAVDEALDRLEAVSREAAELVKLRYFAGFSNAEAAGILGISPRKADQVWAYAKAWLREAIGDDDDGDDTGPG